MIENILMVLGSLVITFLGITGMRWLLCCSPPARKAMKAYEEMERRDRQSRRMSGL